MCIEMFDILRNIISSVENINVSFSCQASSVKFHIFTQQVPLSNF